MKTVKIEKFGSPDVLKVENVKIGKPKTNEVLIKNLSIGINYIDTYPVSYTHLRAHET